MTYIHWEPDNGEVHHYTDTGGLIGIIRNKKFWATNIQFMNDSLEHDSGLQRVTKSLDDALKRLREDDSGEITHTDELHESVQTIKKMLRGAGANPKDGQYVCCFSNHYDDLGQWRGYARDGYCITFDKDELTKSLSESQPDQRSVRHENVDYGLGFEQNETGYSDAVLRKLHEILHRPDANLEDHGFSASDPTFGDLVRQNNRNALAAIAGVAAYQLTIPFLKEKGFAAEQEMRVCVSYPTTVDFRPSKIGPIPYTELAFDPHSIKSVTVGPGLNMDLRQATLEYLLVHEFGKDHGIQIKKTGLSFRG
ncbi:MULTISPECIES: DUF2971 domain-containing protein [Rhodococcus]|uniref:DUF2971 domain-containing protein n=1 Tax=Rhodococcus TaxID=1827 RepID=UPI001E411BAD|nr:DUF2971 domain-containing protein [Rhodococcus pyridinivorans]MCD2116457.1 DUF2971 domain-containing protein [Rhodococcus pyridinivorans]MCZ4625598.1 DUF2971 domain-containing protein [Rhodococcus pyridinivorans]MCZ4646808.1 DUF2971 domain-containing protein [Rhodococcus pyridinivorans]MDJ0482164.1 DUF2971 domain-containing protein [Rhodococcus pyridinivorans]MDV7252638.1 DUF2971 domain-containing protein [Rhodococcus pyridinivorans]